MAAMTAATTHAPLMASVLVFELSSDYAIVLPLMLGGLVLSGTGMWLVVRRLKRVATADTEWALECSDQKLHITEHTDPTGAH